MYTNADITIYLFNNGAYTRLEIKGKKEGEFGAFWSDSKQSNVKTTGLVEADSVKLMIPYSSATGLVFTTSKDLVIKGIVEDIIDVSSPQKLSESKAALSKKYKMHTVTSADNKDYGSISMRHYDLSLK